MDDDSSPAQSAIGKADEFADEHREKEQEFDLNEVKSITDDELQKELKRFLIPKLRSASYRWAERSKAIKNARVSRGLYRCAACGCDMKNGEFIVDHLEPVVPLSGWDGKDWTTYITRMFCAAENFQIICKVCSTIKTDFEVQMRKLNRQKKKENG